MRIYDNACAKYYNNLNVKCLPLNTWEFRNYSILDEVFLERIQSNWNTKQDFIKQAQKENREIIVTDKNFKIVFVSNTFFKMSGYHNNELLGKSPSKFQGEKTAKSSREKIRTAIANLQPFKEVILNYKKNGESYWCEIEAFPMFDKNGVFINYIALEKIAS